MSDDKLRKLIQAMNTDSTLAEDVQHVIDMTEYTKGRALTDVEKADIERGLKDAYMRVDPSRSSKQRRQRR
jgi:hypothetical protein